LTLLALACSSSACLARSRFSKHRDHSGPRCVRAIEALRRMFARHALHYAPRPPPWRTRMMLPSAHGRRARCGGRPTIRRSDERCAVESPRRRRRLRSRRTRDFRLRQTCAGAHHEE
jgi:hypothetical protein